MKTALLSHLQSELSRIKNTPIQVTGCRQVYGGDISTTYVLFCKDANYFVKLNNIAYADMLLKEMKGLNLLRTATTSLKIPTPLLHGIFEQQTYLLMEYLEKGTESNALWQQLATGLAQLHQTTQAHFGLDDHNYIGTVVQHNAVATSWPQFYTAQRIMPLIKQVYNTHKCTMADVQLAVQFCNKLPELMPVESPALLHGDFWSGNRLFTAKGEAAIYDPAVYYGHREMDIAMTLLFGGFNHQFYITYNEVFPLQEDWRNRIDICQLYPLLVHLILFGGHYYNSVKNILKKYA